MPFFRKISVILQNDPGTVQQKEARWTQLKTDSEKINYFFRVLKHTAGSDTIFVQIYMDPPPEVPGVSKDAPGSTKHAI